jgi:hypothetical protein
VILEYYSRISTYLTQTFGPNVIFFTVLITSITSVVYFIIVSYSITQLDKQYFMSKKDSADNLAITVGNDGGNLLHLSSSVKYLLHIVKILVGFCLVILGIIMLVLPGQGLITILVGLSLIPFPGKHKLEQHILAKQSVRSTLNWIRIKAKKDPFIFD